MKKKKVQSSNAFEPEADITIGVRRVFEERRRTHQEKKVASANKGDCHVDYCPLSG